jgi:hypothetical protein
MNEAKAKIQEAQLKAKNKANARTDNKTMLLAAAVGVLIGLLLGRK